MIDTLVFFEFIGDAPPRFFYVKDGRQIHFWDEKVPEIAETLEVLSM